MSPKQAPVGCHPNFMLTLDSEDVSKVDGVLGVAVGAGRLRQLGKKPKHAGAKGSDNGVCWPQLLCPASHLGWNSSGFARLAPAASGAAPCHSAAPTPQQHLEDEGVLEDDVGQAAGQHIDRRQQEPPQHNLRAERAAAGRSFRMADSQGGGAQPVKSTRLHPSHPAQAAPSCVGCRPRQLTMPQGLGSSASLVISNPVRSSMANTPPSTCGGGGTWCAS